MSYRLKYAITKDNLPEAAEDMEETKAIQKQLNEAKNKVRIKFEASPLFQFLNGFAQSPLQKGEAYTSLRMEGNSFFVSLEDSQLKKDYIQLIGQHRTPPYSYVGEKTINMLLSGKLLTDEEKRKILAGLKVLEAEEAING